MPATSTEGRPDGRTARWAGHREQRREAFVEAALAVIDRDGPTATVDQIGAELGVTRQAVYRQFADRRDLDHAIADRAAAMLVAHLLPHLDTGAVPDGGVDLDRAIAAVLTAYLDFVQGHLPLYRFVRAHEVDVAGDSAVRRVKDTVAGRIVALAPDVLAGLDLPPGLAETFATGLIGMADAVIGRWLDEPGGLTRDELVELLTLMLGGAVRAATARR